MKKYLVFLLIVFVCPLFAFNLVKDNNPNANVVITEDMTEAEVNAANEFIKYVEEITSIKLPVSNEPILGNNIFFGQSENVKKLLPNFNFNLLKNDGIYIKSQGNYCIFTGDRPSGTLYAVYTYLEDYAGCCFYDPKEEYVPRKSNITINPIEKLYVPPFMSRESFFKVNLGQDDAPYFAKRKLNGNFNNIPSKWGGHICLIGWCHTIPMWLPVAEYGEKHPEWYALYEGKRDIERSDPNICFANNEMRDELTKNVLAQLNKTQDKVIISVSQADTYRYCQCEECKKLYDTYGMSGTNLLLVNHIAEAVKAECPNAYVETLAYQWTRQCPIDVVPNDNVIIRLCDIECDFASPLNSDNNKAFYKDMQDWKKIAKNLYIWDYVVNYSNSHPVFPDFHVLQENIKLFRNNNGIAIFEEGDDFNLSTALLKPKAYILSKLMWDPDIDVNMELKKFFNYYYGPAGSDVYKYLEILTKATLREAPFLKCFNPGNTFLNTKDYLDLFTALYDGYAKVKYEQKYSDRVLVDIYSLQFSLYQANENVQKEVTESGVLGIYNTREKFLKMYMPFSKEHSNAYGQYTVHMDDSELYKY